MRSSQALDVQAPRQRVRSVAAAKSLRFDFRRRGTLPRVAATAVTRGTQVDDNEVSAPTNLSARHQLQDVAHQLRGVDGFGQMTVVAGVARQARVLL